MSFAVFLSHEKQMHPLRKQQNHQQKMLFDLICVCK